MKKILFFLLVAFSLFLQSCSSINQQSIKINSQANAQVMGGKYVLVNNSAFELKGEKYETKIVDMLKQKGYELSRDSKKDYTISFKYEISGPFDGSYEKVIGNSQLSQEDISNFINPPEWLENPTTISYYKKSLTLTAMTSNNTQIWRAESSLKSLNKDSDADFIDLTDALAEYIDKNSDGVKAINP